MSLSYRSVSAVLVAVALLLVGCATTSPSDPATAPTTDSATEPVPAPVIDHPPLDTLDFTPERPPQAWFHMDADDDGYPGLSTHRVHTTLLTDRAPERTVTVAVIDSGTDIAHSELEAQIWTNPDEEPNTGEDNDGNGFVDDVHGWNFIGNPDGEHVDEDTYEVTRLYVEYRSFAESLDDDADLTPAQQDSLDYYETLREDFRAKRDDAEQRYENVRQAHQIVEQTLEFLRDYLEVDEVTPEHIAALADDTNPMAEQAYDVLTFFYDQGVTPQDIKDFYDRMHTQVNFGYDTSFDPRPIVGDDYTNWTETGYGNPDVHGPDPGHGTHVSGIIGAERDTSLTIDGIAPVVRIMPVRAVPNGDERDKDVANAIRYAADNGADIINMSFGKGYSPQKHVVDDAVRYADSLGVLMVHAAGNSAENNDASDNFPNPFYKEGHEEGDRATHWLEVGASSWSVDETLAANFSNYGAETVDVFAPGADIYSSTTGNDYRFNSGTSMAAPMVSGLAALLMAYYPDLDAETVRQIIKDSAVRYPDLEVERPNDDPDAPAELVPFSDLSITGGIVNAYRAVEMAEEHVNE